MAAILLISCGGMVYIPSETNGTPIRFRDGDEGIEWFKANCYRFTYAGRADLLMSSIRDDHIEAHDNRYAEFSERRHDPFYSYADRNPNARWALINLSSNHHVQRQLVIAPYVEPLPAPDIAIIPDGSTCQPASGREHHTQPCASRAGTCQRQPLECAVPG